MTTSSKTAQLELKTNATLGEGAIWNHRTQELYWVDIEGKKLHIYNPAAGTNRSFSMPSRIGTVVPGNNGQAFVALEDGIYTLDLTSEQLTLFAPVEADRPEMRFNDGKCDAAGRLWVGSMGLEERDPVGALYQVNPDGTVIPRLRAITISNGITWTYDQRTMYYIDTPTSQVRAYDFDPVSGQLSGERIAVEIDPALGFPDGMTIDAEDKIWVAMWEGSAVLRFDPTTGALLERIDVPALKVTSCAFGGPDLDTLYITSASINMTAAQHERYPDAGSLFSVRPGVRGVEASFFAT